MGEEREERKTLAEATSEPMTAGMWESELLETRGWDG